MTSIDSAGVHSFEGCTGTGLSLQMPPISGELRLGISGQGDGAVLGIGSSLTVQFLLLFLYFFKLWEGVC